ncbi:MAG TPA: hypothetical protein VFG23_01620, partial [Polyangia bacterium]|nr:hypothetical protein [Polyangia bacterium]
MARAAAERPFEGEQADAEQQQQRARPELDGALAPDADLARRSDRDVRQRLETVVAAAESSDKPLRTLRVTTGPEGEAQVDVGALPPGAYRLTGRASIEGRPVTQEETFVVRAGG